MCRCRGNLCPKERYREVTWCKGHVIHRVFIPFEGKVNN